MAKKKKENSILKYIGYALLLIIKIPYYVVKGTIKLFRKASIEIEKNKIKKKRNSIRARYREFKKIKEIEGEYGDWFEKTITSDSKIGIIIGARGTGKTAFGIKFLENIYAKTNKKCFAIGFKEQELPSWINVVSEISQLENDSFVLIDEGGILFSSRSSMSSANKMLSSLMLIARHKNISILFISQNSSNLEVNILRQADYLVIKPSSLLQKEFERKIIQKIYKDIEKEFKKNKQEIGLTYIYSDDFRGLISNPLPSFWREEISKSFKEK